MIRNKTFMSLTVIGLFLLFHKLDPIVATLFENVRVGQLVERSIRIILILTSCLLFFKPKHVLTATGLQKGFVKGLLVSLLCTLPMFIGYAIVGDFNTDLTPLVLMQKAWMAGFFEEILFRAFLFGLLFRFCNWGFIPAAVLSAVIFASAHLYQANEIAQAMGVLAATGMGGMWFAWLYIEWDKNLWLPIFMHVLMNAAWGIFSIADNAAGGLNANIFRIMTIVISVILTLYMIKKRGFRNIGLKQLIRNPRSEELHIV